MDEKQRKRLEGAITPKGCGSARSYTQPSPVEVPPNWKIWKHLPEVKTWQACALALNMEPDGLGYSPATWDGQPEAWRGLPSKKAEHFFNLLRLLEANMSNEQHFTPTHHGTVRLSEFAAWCAPVVRGLTGCDIPPELAALAKAAPATKVKAGTGINVFRTMDKLTADDVSIAFVGDKPEPNSDVGANNFLEISARDETSHIALAVLGLVKQSGGLNSQGAMLLGFARNQEPPGNEANAQTISRLRTMFRDHLGIKSDPFDPKAAKWKPRFKIADKRGAAHERAKREALNKTDSYEQMNERGEKAGNTNDYTYEDEDDAAGELLRNNAQA